MLLAQRSGTLVDHRAICVVRHAVELRYIFVLSEPFQLQIILIPGRVGFQHLLFLAQSVQLLLVLRLLA